MSIETEVETLRRHLRDFKQFEYEERILRQKYEKALKEICETSGKSMVHSFTEKGHRKSVEIAEIALGD